MGNKTFFKKYNKIATYNFIQHKIQIHSEIQAEPMVSGC